MDMKKDDNKKRLEGQVFPDEQVEASLPAHDVDSPNPPVDAEEEDDDTEITDAPPSMRESLRGRLGDRYSDRNLDDDEEFYGALDDEMGRLSTYEEDGKKLGELFDKDPRSAHFLAAWANGKDATVELIRRFGPEFREALDDPDRIEAIAEAEREYVERAENAKELEEEYEQNMVETLRNFDDYQSENGLDDEEIDEIMEYLRAINSDAVVGKVSKETIDMAYKALNHDNDVAMAENVGEVRGRNARISEKLRKPEQGDGMANVGGSNSGVRNVPRRGTSIFERAAMAK